MFFIALAAKSRRYDDAAGIQRYAAAYADVMLLTIDIRRGTLAPARYAIRHAIFDIYAPCRYG